VWFRPNVGSFLGKGTVFRIYLARPEPAFTSLFDRKKGFEGVGRLFNSVCEKGLGKLLETQDHYSLTCLTENDS
jgi:hypothetical protein